MCYQYSIILADETHFQAFFHVGIYFSITISINVYNNIANFYLFNL